MRAFIVILVILQPILFIACFNSKKALTVYPDCSSTDIEKMDTCLLGLTIRQAINKLKLDTSQISTIQEPLAVVRGISYMPDANSRVDLFVLKTPIKPKLDSIVQTNGQRIQSKYLYYFIVDMAIVTVHWEREQGGRGKTLTTGNY